MKNHLADSASILEQLGFAGRAQTLRAELGRLERQNFKVAVIGQFKVGKSTLINKVFLKQDVLFTDLMEATAVPTEIEYGQPGRLEVYPYVAALEGSPWVKENPEPADIQAHTSAQGDEARAQMARDTSRARLFWPAESLKGLTVVDTPGINTPNEAVAATTYRVIPDADVTVFMTRAQQLTEIDIAFLRSRVFDRGVSRCLAVVTYDPKACNQQDLNKVLTANKAKLGAIGRDYVPVVGVNLSTESVKGNLGDKIMSEEIGAEVPAEADSLAAFEQTLSSFIRQNAVPGRMERANSLSRRELEKARLECQVELSALQKTEEEKSAIKKKIEAEAEAYHQHYLRLGDKFLQDLRSIQRFHLKAIADGLDAVGVNYTAKINNCSGLGEIQELLRKAQSEMQPDVEELMYRVSDQTRKKITELENSYRAYIQEAAEPWIKTVVNELQIDGGFLAKLPTWTIWLADIILTIVVLPGGGFIDIFLRLIASKIPGLRDLLPVILATKAIAHHATKSITTQISEVKTQIREQLDRGFIEAEKKIQENWEAHGQEQLKTVLDPIERTMQEARDPKRAQTIESGLQSINEILGQLG